MQAIIFDLDGTLYQTELIAIAAFQKTFATLREKNLYHGQSPTVTQIKSVFGMTGQEFWKRLLPEADETVRMKADEILLKYELELIEQGKGKFYPDVVLSLYRLREAGWHLFIASNGIKDYVHAVLDSANITHLFTDIYTVGDHPQQKKKDAVRRCIDQYQIREGYMVGDRSSDVEAGKANELITIGCRYEGYPHFGELYELEDADYVIKHFRELFQYICGQ